MNDLVIQVLHCSLVGVKVVRRGYENISFG